MQTYGFVILDLDTKEFWAVCPPNKESYFDSIEEFHLKPRPQVKRNCLFQCCKSAQNALRRHLVFFQERARFSEPIGNKSLIHFESPLLCNTVLSLNPQILEQRPLWIGMRL